MQDESRMSPWDMFNMEVPDDHMPARGVHPRAAKAIVNSEAWTDARPEMNLSSFVTTFMEPEEVELAREHLLKNHIDQPRRRDNDRARRRTHPPPPYAGPPGRWPTL